MGSSMNGFMVSYLLTDYLNLIISKKSNVSYY